jgi:hypothetical protein
VQAATPGAAPTIFTNRIKRFGLLSGDMVKVMQDDAGDEANHEPESRQKSCLESGRHAFNHVTDWQVTPGRIRYEGRRV